MQRAVIYARYSSDKQREASIEDQIRECKMYATANGFEVIKTYADYALSGTTDERAQFQLMIKDSAKKAFTAVLIYKTDRFARNRFDSAIYKKKLKDNGVRVYPIKEPIPEGPGGIVMEALYESMAEMYSTNLSENVRRGMNSNARKGLVNSRPSFGYKIDPATRRYVIDEEQAPILREIFHMAATGKKYREIRSYLAAKGYHHHSNWLTTTFRNRRYLGFYIYGDIEIAGGMPQLVDQDTFDRVNATIANRKRRAPSKREVYQLSAKLFCGECGELMTGMYGTSRDGTKHRYYHCKNKCLKNIPTREIEPLVAKTIAERFFTDEVIQELAQATVDYQKKVFEEKHNCTELRYNLSECTKKLENVYKAIENGIISTGLKVRLQELEMRKEKLSNLIAAEQLYAPKFSKADIVAFLSQYKDGDISDPEYASRLFNIFGQQVVAFEDHIVIRYSIDSEQGTRINTGVIPCSNSVSVGGPSRIRTYDQAVMSRRLWTN